MTGPIQDAMTGCLERHRGRTALVDGSESLSYDGLGERIQAASRALRAALAGVSAEAPRHVGFCLGNRLEYVVLYFATLYAGDLPLLLDANFNTGEIEAIRSDCGLDVLVLERAKAEGLALPGKGEPAPFAADVVLLPLIQSAARNWVLGTGMTGEDRTLCLAALSNGLAFNTSLLSTFLAGGELHFRKGAPLTRPVARQIAESRITRLVAFPTLYRNFVAPGGPEPSAMASLQHAISAGAPLWPDVREEFRARYGLDISDYYGIAETGPCTF